MAEAGLPSVGISFPTPLPCNGVPISGLEITEGAKQIERLGFAGIWMADVIGRGYFALDPLVGLAAVAAATSTVELGSCIVQVPLSNPVTLARRVLTAGHVAQGRFVLGVGAGSTRADFQAVDGDFDHRFRILEEHLSTMKSLWAGERVGQAQLDPWPAMVGGPPILIGTWGGKWLERAAAEFDGWIGSGAHCTWEMVESAARRFRAAGGKRAVLVSVIADLDEKGPAGSRDPVNLRCSPEEARRRLGRLAEHGINDVVLIDANRRPGHLEALAELVPARPRPDHAGRATTTPTGRDPATAGA
jgi:alkanesulfonate monooxygenase SsuD/methylene tetrahydromethanopterin reductase-like flavin-dependent oxidoreductase (luciferase family)